MLLHAMKSAILFWAPWTPAARPSHLKGRHTGHENLLISLPTPRLRTRPPEILKIFTPRSYTDPEENQNISPTLPRIPPMSAVIHPPADIAVFPCANDSLPLLRHRSKHLITSKFSTRRAAITIGIKSPNGVGKLKSMHLERNVGLPQAPRKRRKGEGAP